jgi:hypothetical protein
LSPHLGQAVFDKVVHAHGGAIVTGTLLEYSGPIPDKIRPENWQLCARLLPHSEAVIRLGDAGPEREALSRLIESVAATYMIAQVQTRSAALRARPGDQGEGARARTSRHRPEPQQLGLLLSDQGELATARPLYERALGIREKVLGPEHPDTAQGLNNLASLLWKEGALAIWEEELGLNTPPLQISSRARVAAPTLSG